MWQWNHNPNKEAWKLNPEKGILYLKTVKTSVNLLQASNCLTQRLLYPKCVVEVNIDGSDLKEGDIAGICALQSAYSLLGITKSGGSIYLVQMAKGSKGSNAMGEKINLHPGVIMEKKWIEQAKLRLRLIANFEDMDDVVEYQYSYDHQEKESARKWHKIGINNKHYFTLDHFVGCRVGLFMYSTLEVGGRVAFRDFEVVGNS